MADQQSEPQTPLAALNGTSSSQKEWADDFINGFKALQKKVASAFQVPAEALELHAPANPPHAQQDIITYQTMSGEVMAVHGLQSAPKQPVSEVVLPDGSSALAPGIPTQEQVVKTGTKIGTESIGTDAWDVYKMPSGRMVRVVAFPPPNAGKVYDYSVTPPLYDAPYMQRKVNPAERKLFSDISIEPQRAAARVEVAKIRSEHRAERERAAARNARRILQAELEGWQQAQIKLIGFFDLVSPTGSRYRVDPEEPSIAYKLDGYDRPVGVVTLKRGQMCDEQVSHILSLRTGTLTSEAVLSKYQKSDAPWPILPPVPGQEAAGRIASLEFA